MTPPINQVSVAGRVQQLGAGAMQTLHDSLKSVHTAGEGKTKGKRAAILFSYCKQKTKK